MPYRTCGPLLLTLLTLLTATMASGQTREQKVRDDKQKVEADGFWIYNDLPRAFREAKSGGKPILVVLRCIPCEECVKLDDELVDQHPVIRPLMEKFICVRQVSTNGLDLDLFQYDTDQSFAVFMLNSDRTIYGRFGTRSHRTEWVGDVSLEGLAKALQGALDLHANSDGEKAALAEKRGRPQRVKRPELYPSLKEKYSDSLNYAGDVVKSCIHCHQIGDAQRESYRSAGQPIPEEILFPYPHPRIIGLTLDPREMATITQVEDGSAAAAAGFQAGDQIQRLNGQPLLSIADVQWVLHQLDVDGDQVQADIRRSGQKMSLTLKLEPGWRQADDISWRVTSWGLRRMTTGGLKLRALDERRRADLGIGAGKMALLVEHLGQYGAHAAAKRAGFRKGDVLIEFAGRDDLLTDSALLAHGVSQHLPGERLDVTVLRDGQRRALKLPMQK